MRTLLAFGRVWLAIAGIWLWALPPGRRTAGPGVAELIRAEVAAWPGVTVEPHRFGGIEFRLGRRELGHLHGDVLADLPFPRRVRDELVAAGRALPHHILPASGWVSLPLRDASAVPEAVALFRLSYERALAQRRPADDDAAEEVGEAS